MGRGLLAVLGGQEFNLDFLPGKGLLGPMKPNRVREQLWQQWEERKRGKIKKPTLTRLKNEGVNGVHWLMRIKANSWYSKMYVRERRQKQKLV